MLLCLAGIDAHTYLLTFFAAGTTFIVDGFAFASPRCSAYFLTHCHSDHTVGLRRDFAATIYCSPVSARVLAHDWGLRAPQVQVLQLGQPLLLQGVTVTAIDANHCPGAVMLLFEVPGTDGSITRVLHTGDCRWAGWPALHGAAGIATRAIRRHMGSMHGQLSSAG